MDNTKTQQTWTHAMQTLFCGQCKSARLQIWNKPKATVGNALKHVVTVGDQMVALHCDYFRKRIEHPDQLVQCGAFQKRERSAERRDPE
jgi:hypothetical protein